MLNQIAFYGALESGLIYSLVAFSIYLSFRILDFPDLTVEGTFPLGGAVAIVLIIHGFNPWFASLIAAMTGFIAGAVTGFLNVGLKIMHLLASILVMYALYSINLRIMGRPNLPLGGRSSVLSALSDNAPNLHYALVPVIVFALIVLAVTVLLYLFMKSETGLAMRATGANSRMARAQGISTGAMIILGIAIANALVALAGAMFAQSRQAADVGAGIGILVIGLASLIGGEAVLNPKKVATALIACIIGSVLFRLIVAIALETMGDTLHLLPGDINLLTAILMLIAIKFGSIRGFFLNFYRRKFPRSTAKTAEEK
ncbi:MAG: ABC transporter permease [Cardiobacteriaceae bacterium]|nr:ABC transporter permease [Cardiobacteriaceae bacterium]